jgi:hypothetical protein
MYPAFVRATALGLDGMHCTLVLFSFAGFLSLFRIAGFKSAGFDRCAIVMVRQQTWQESNNSY